MATYIIEKPGLCTEVSSMEYSALRALHEKPDNKDSKHDHFTHSRTRERREVYDGPGTVISVKKSEW